MTRAARIIRSASPIAYNPHANPSILLIRVRFWLPEPKLAQELTREFGYTWPSLVTRLSFVALGVLLLSATLAMVLASRRVAGWHMIRSLVGPAGMMLAI